MQTYCTPRKEGSLLTSEIVLEPLDFHLQGTTVYVFNPFFYKAAWACGDKIPCLVCKNEHPSASCYLSSNGYARKLRRVMGLSRTHFLYYSSLRCKTETGGCGKQYSSVSKEILDLLGPAVSGCLPLIITLAAGGQVQQHLAAGGQVPQHLADGGQVQHHAVGMQLQHNPAGGRQQSPITPTRHILTGRSPASERRVRRIEMFQPVQGDAEIALFNRLLHEQHNGNRPSIQLFGKACQFAGTLWWT